MNYACPACRVIYGRENGYFTGAMIVSPVFRYSRVIWMHFDRMVDPNLESERYAARSEEVGYSRQPGP